MSDNKTMIRFYSVLLVVFAALTYAVDLNGQFKKSIQNMKTSFIPQLLICSTATTQNPKTKLLSTMMTYRFKLITT